MDILRDYKNLLEQTTRAAKIGIWEVDLHSDRVYWCEVTKSIHEVDLNYECTVATALNFYKDKRSEEVITQAYEKALETGITYDVRVQITTPKGKEKWVRAIGIPVFEKGNCIRLYGLFQDVDSEVRDRKELDKQRKLFKSTFEHTSIGMALVGLQGQWIEVNPSLCHMLGYQKEEFYQLTFQEITHKDDLADDLALLDKMLSGTIGFYKMEKRYFHKDGSVVWAELTVTLARDEKNTPLHFISQIVDLTEKKEALHKVESLLNVTQDQNDRLLNFAHIVSHNLRSHSSNLNMLLDLIQLQHPETETIEMFPMLGKAVHKLGETIKHLNEVMLIHSKNADLIESVNLFEYLENTLYVLSASILETNCRVINAVDKHICFPYIPAYLESILLNLLSNAIKYRSVERIPEIILSSRQTDAYYILDIQDNGLGIDLESHKNKIFGMYKTFHKNADARGIGLFLTKNQINAMDGKIELTSKINKGTTFHLYFKR